LVIVHHFSRFTYTLFIASKNDAFDVFKKLAKALQNQNCGTIKNIRTDHVDEFQNERFKLFFEK